MNIKKLLPFIGIIILIYLLTTIDLPKVIDIFSTIPPLFIILSFLALVPILFFLNIEWQILLKKQHIHVSFVNSLKNIFIGYFYGFITPGGFGGYIRAIYLKQDSGAPIPKCLSNIITMNSIDYLSLLFLGAVGAVFLSGYHSGFFLPIIIAFLILLSLFIIFLKKNK